MYLLIMIYMYMHVHVSVTFSHPPSLVVTGNLYYLQGETPLVIATRNGHTQVVDFIKSRLPQGEYIVTVLYCYYISMWKTLVQSLARALSQIIHDSSTTYVFCDLV